MTRQFANPHRLSIKLQSAVTHMKAAFISAIDLMNRVVHIVIALALLAMVVLISVQIGVRFVLPKLGFFVSLPWTEELARYLMVWVVFLGGAIAARHGLLIAVLALVDAVPEHIARMMKLVSLLVLMVFFITMAYHGYVWSVFGAGEISPAMTVSKYWLYLAMPVGFVMAALNTCVVLLRVMEPD